MKYDYFIETRNNYEHVSYRKFNDLLNNESIKEIDSSEGKVVALTNNGFLFMISLTCGPLSDVTPDLEWDSKFYIGKAD